ncbi:hypothetical protein BX600DRAFT_523474 [Xylariales sp. PMI_506]|nr:hypothetical protein BX600DRAFT_523474 [Xylariales sp. PMI_506]
MAEPCNLLDTDFDESTIELPLSRPETEVTPVLYILAKNRIDRMSDLVNDLLINSREYSYDEVIELDRKLKMAEASLPPIFRWQPFSQSFMVPPQIVVHSLGLRLSKQRLNIRLHRKYLAPSYTHVEYKYSQTACIQAAIEILEFQQLVDEETRPDGMLYPVRFMTTTSVGQFVFLLGMSIISYYLQLAKTWPEMSLDQDMSTKIHNLLHNSYRIWLRSSTVSREAREATEHLSLLLGLRAQAGDQRVAEQPAETAAISTTTNATISSDFTTSQDAIMPFDNVNWDAFQAHGEFPRSSVFSADFLVPPVPVPVPGSSSAGGVFMASAVDKHRRFWQIDI